MSGTQALLSEYTQGGSEQAFRELVGAYVNFVFSTALRIVAGDRALAEDVTQTVFTDLARKAALLPKDIRLGGWLHRHTCFVAKKTLRRERRRIAREKQAIELHSTEDYSEANLAQLALVLDEAINDLGEQDRNAIVLRFFEELDFRSIGEALGSSEDAARMRVSRAVEKMGALLKRRGIALTAAGVSFVLSGKLATAAPAGLATRIIYVELARPVKVGIFAILKEACFTRLNVGIVSTAVVLGLFVLLMSGRHARARVTPDPNGQTFTPAEFADLAVEEPENQQTVQTEVAPERSAPAAPVSAPKPMAIVPTETVAVKPIANNAPRGKPTQIAAQPPAVPPIAMGDGDSAQPGQSFFLPHGIPGGRPLGQHPGTSATPRRATVPPVAGTIWSNSTSAPLVRPPPTVGPTPTVLLQPSTPSTPGRAMAAASEPSMMLPEPTANDAFVQPVQSLQPQRILPSSRSSDPRKRGQQP